MSSCSPSSLKSWTIFWKIGSSWWNVEVVTEWKYCRAVHVELEMLFVIYRASLRIHCILLPNFQILNYRSVVLAFRTTSDNFSNVMFVLPNHNERLWIRNSSLCVVCTLEIVVVSWISWNCCQVEQFQSF